MRPPRDGTCGLRGRVADTRNPPPRLQCKSRSLVVHRPSPRHGLPSFSRIDPIEHHRVLQSNPKQKAMAAANGPSPWRLASVYSEVQTSRLHHALQLPSVLTSQFSLVDGPPSSATGNPGNSYNHRRPDLAPFCLIITFGFDLIPACR